MVEEVAERVDDLGFGDAEGLGDVEAGSAQKTGAVDTIPCAHCGARLPPGYALCGKCGMPLKKAACDKCGAALIEGFAFCGKCGARVE